MPDGAVLGHVCFSALDAAAAATFDVEVGFPACGKFLALAVFDGDAVVTLYADGVGGLGGLEVAYDLAMLGRLLAMMDVQERSTLDGDCRSIVKREWVVVLFLS